MLDESFFFDQPSRRLSHQFGRRRRDLDELHRALYHVQVLLSSEDKKPSDRILPRLNQPILPDILTKDLDRLLPVVARDISLPSFILVQFHSTWPDLIQKTNYRFPVKIFVKTDFDEKKKISLRFGKRRSVKISGISF